MFWFSKKKKEKREKISLTPEHKDILKKIFNLPIQTNWLDENVIEKILRDATVESCIGSRKAATTKKEINITCKDENIKKELEKIFDYDILDSILETPYYGFSVFEINWENKNNIFYPNLYDRDYRDFLLENKELKFSGNGIAEDIPPYKAIYTTYRAKDKKPYGRPLLNTLYWLIEFKNASLEFWIQLLEKFGTPWVIGKTGGNKNDFAEEIYNMLGGDGAVLDNEDSIEIVTAKDKGNYKELIDYIDTQIRQLILGGNLTAEVKGGSLAAASVHQEVREDLAQADGNIVLKAINTVINYFKELNQIDIEIVAILKDKDDPNKALADRDKVIYDMGYKPTKEYIENTYNIKVEQIEQNKVIPNSNNILKTNLLKMNNIPNDELDRNTQNIDLEEISLTFQKQILEIINNSDSYEEMADNLFKAYPTFDTRLLEDVLFQYLLKSQLLAVATIKEENPNG